MSIRPLDALVRDTAGLTLESAEAFLLQPGWGLLVVAGDPTHRPEAQDLAVVTRELLRRAPAGTRVGVLTGPDEEALKQRFGLAAVPGLLFVREGRVLSTLQRMQDWSVYQRVADVLWGAARKSPEAA
jgi:hypothetical protein